MNDFELKNGLTPIQIDYDKSSLTAHDTTWNDVVEKITDTTKYAVFYFAFGIRFALWDGKTFHFAEEMDAEKNLPFLQLARIFDASKEIKIWRSNGSLKYRTLIGEGAVVSPDEDFNAVAAQQILWGTWFEPTEKNSVKLSLNGKNEFHWIKAYEERGVELVVPLDVKLEAIPGRKKEKEKNDQTRIAVQTYNYVDHLENGLATYVDSRFVNIKIV